MGQKQEESVERWTAKRQAALVLRVIKGEASVTEAARQHGLTVSEAEGWQDQFLRAAENGLRRRPKSERILPRTTVSSALRGFRMT